jgi:hypothetical protein
MFLFDIIAGIASILGLGFSIAAWRGALRAEAAAQQARKAVRKSNAAEALKDLNRDASELLGFIQSGQYQAAGVRARDLFMEIRAARSRWGRFLAEEAAANLKGAQVKIEKISNSLRSPTPNVPETAQKKLMDYGHGVVAILSEESSKIVAVVEAEEE